MNKTKHESQPSELFLFPCPGLAWPLGPLQTTISVDQPVVPKPIWNELEDQLEQCKRPVPPTESFGISSPVVQLAEDRMKSARSEAMFQDTVLFVDEMQRLADGFKRGNFSKAKLQGVIQRLLAGTELDT